MKGFDVVSGKLVWTFYLKAQPGDPNRSTWLAGSAESEATPDPGGLSRLTSSAAPLHPGRESRQRLLGRQPRQQPLQRFAGRARRQHRQDEVVPQLVHHDIWDYDLAAAPILFDVRRGGRTIPAVADKMALLFIFNRETGEPIRDERKVPQNAPRRVDVADAAFPVKPPPLARNSLKRSELSKVTPEHKAFCEALWDSLRSRTPCPTIRGASARTSSSSRRAGRRQLARFGLQQTARP